MWGRGESLLVTGGEGGMEGGSGAIVGSVELHDCGWDGRRGCYDASSRDLPEGVRVEERVGCCGSLSFGAR